MMNGLNGANMGGMPVSIPTPAGHQAELNYIYGMVEELSRQLAENKRALEDVVSGVGRVRARARQHALGNDEIIDSAADEINGAYPPPHTSFPTLSTMAWLTAVVYSPRTEPRPPNLPPLRSPRESEI
jgi:hypothetical protein